jgi:hypothetical protein
MFGGPRSAVRLLPRPRPGGRPVTARFDGYGLLSLALESGDVVAFRRVTTSSVGPPFTAALHRDPAGRWRQYVNIAPHRTCAPFFAAAVEETRMDEITLVWKGRREVSLYVRDARLHLALRLEAGAAARALAAAAAVMPSAAWDAAGVLRVMDRAAAAALGTGGLGLSSTAPSGHLVRLRPRGVWHVAAAAAVLDGRDLGPMLDPAGPLAMQHFLLPGRPLFVAATTEFLWPAGARAGV